MIHQRRRAVSRLIFLVYALHQARLSVQNVSPNFRKSVKGNRSQDSIVIRRICINSGKLLPASSKSLTFSAPLTIRTYQRDSHRTHFGEINYWEHLRKSVEKLQIWLKFDSSVGQLTWRPKTIDSNTKQSVAGSSAKETYSWVSKAKPSVLLVNSCMKVNYNTTKGTHCCLSMATMFTPTRHNIKFYVHCQFFSVFKYLSFIPLNRFVKYDIIL
jgi:hypothetical protein